MPAFRVLLHSFQEKMKYLKGVIWAGEEKRWANAL
jgi:hypothetical protein